MVPAVQALEQKIHGADLNQEQTDPEAITESKLT